MKKRSVPFPFLFACYAVTLSPANAQSPTAATASNAPVTINSCTPMLRNGNGQSVEGIQLTQQSSGIRIQFTNESGKTANLINFSVDSNGTSFVIRDVGTFSPGVEITHRYKNGAGQSFVLPAFIAPQLTCAVDSVHFADGTVWQNGVPDTMQTPAPAFGPGGSMNATPSRVEAPLQGEVQYFMVSTGEKVAGFSERDACQGIADVALVAAGGSSATYSVKPVARGSCVATVRDQDGHTLSVPITIR